MRPLGALLPLVACSASVVLRSYIPSEAERVAYYLGRACMRGNISATADYNAPFVFDCAHPPLTSVTKREARFFKPYNQDMLTFCKTVGGRGSYVVQFGDRPARAYSLCKSRRIRRPCCILLPFNTERHWNFKKVYGETPWDRKYDRLVWRGVTTGAHVRRRFVHALSSEHDVRFSGVVQQKKHWINQSTHLGKQLSKRQILRYKYVLSLPGNDVATNLKWLMAQQSVVVMPTPRVEGWLMEGLLMPYVHYVPLDDPRNVDEVLAWMRQHDRECRRIVRNANEWMATSTTMHPLIGRILEYARDRTWDQHVRRDVAPSASHFE